MKLSTKSRYSLRILLQLATKYGQESSAIKGRIIAKVQNISEPYLEQIMISLKSAGLVKTIRGCHGGYVLNRAPEDISILDIIELYEGKIKLSDCAEGSNSNCELLSVCAATGVWEHLTNVFKNEASNITLDKVLGGKEFGFAGGCYDCSC